MEDSNNSSRASSGRLPVGNDIRMVVSTGIYNTFQTAGEIGKLPINRCKILILGDEGVGKTSLRKHCMGEEIPADHIPTVGIESFEVETFDLESNWQKRSHDHDDLNRSAAWWVVSHYKEELNQSRQAHSAKRFGSLIYIISTCILVFLTVFSLRDGFTHGFFFYFLMFFLVFAFLFWDFYYAYDAASTILVYMVLYNAILQKEIIDYEEWPLSLSEFLNLCIVLILSLSVSFSMGFFGKSGLLMVLCMMNAPNEVQNNLFTDMFSITGKSLMFDYHSYANVLFLYAGTGLGYGMTYFASYGLMKLQVIDQLKNHKEATIEIISLLGAFFLLMVSLVIFSCSSVYYALHLFVLGIPLGSTVNIGLSTGRKTFLSSNLGVITKMCLSGLAGFIFGYLLGWRPLLSWKILYVLPFLTANGYAWLKLRRGLGKESFPMSELLRAYKASKTGSSDLPIVFTLMDFAGQKDYYEMHHAFMVDTAIYFIVFSLCDAIKNIDSQYQRILFWLNKISLHARLSKTPAVYLVGTHRDSLRNFTNAESLVQNIAVEITSRIQSSRMFSNLFVFNDLNDTILYSVENASSSRNDSGLVQLKASIQNTAKTCVGGEEHELKWLRLVRVCQDLASQGYKLVKRDHMWKYIQKDLQCQSSFDEKDFQVSLSLANRAGYIIYRDSSYLKEYIVTDQYFLINIMKRFLEPAPSWALQLAADWDALQTEGIASLELMSFIIQMAAEEGKSKSLSSFGVFWKSHSSSSEEGELSELEAVIGYLKEIDFLHECADSSVSNIEGARYFLIPSKLSELHESSTTADTPVDIYISCEDAPLTDIFPRLVARSLNKCPDVHRQMLRRSKLFRNSVTIQDAEMGSFRIEAKMEVPEQQLLHMCAWPLKDQDALKILTRFLHNLDLIVERYFPYLNYTVGVKCINPDCCEMRKSQYIHILPISWNLKETASLRSLQQKHIAFCGTKLYQVDINKHSISVQEITTDDVQTPRYRNQKKISQEEVGATVWQVANIIVLTSLSEWKSLARELGVVECDIEAIEYDYCRDLKEQCRQGIWAWWKECDTDDVDSIRTLLGVLKELSIQSAVDSIIEAFPEVKDDHRMDEDHIKVE